VVILLRVGANLKNCSVHSVLALSFAWAAVICCTLPAVGDQALGPQRSDPEQQDPDYNGEDFTRPQRSFDTRFTYTSSGTTSPTDRESWLLRGNWKTDLSDGWRLGLLAQVPVVDKTTFDPYDQEFGIGDAAFQAALLHDIDRHWALGFGARLVTPTAEDTLGSGKFRSCQGSGYAIPSLKLGPTPISCLLFDMRSALRAILRDGISVNRRLHQH